VSLSSFLERCAWVLVFAALCEQFARKYCPKLVLFAGQHSLTLYVVHLVLISSLEQAGLPFQSFSLGVVIGIIPVVMAVSLAATALVAWGLSFVKPSPRVSSLVDSASATT
jgi:surface polysaccharide O-acyltransferase-like enzyme